MKTPDNIKKIFVTGADGMLGSNICRELIKQDYTVKAMILPNRKTNSVSDLNIEIIEGNILDKKFLEMNMIDCDAVIHTAALTTVWPRRSKKVMSVNIEGTKNVSEFVRKYKLKRMVFIGSSCTFSPGNKTNPGNEKTPFSWVKFGMDYMNSKHKAQEMLLKMHSIDEFPVIIISPTYMIGPYDSAPSSGRMILALLSNRIPGYTKGGKNFVFSKDVATAAVNALKLGKLGECYIAGNENLSYDEFFKKVCDIEKKEFKLIKVPQFIILTIGLFNSIVARITKNPPALSYTMARVACIEQYFSSEKARLELKMPQTPIEKGIEQCITWFKSNGYIT